jgi:ABC-2 type transport system permease protein
MTSLLNIFWLGLKEIRSLISDKVMVIFVIYAFTLAIQVQATGTSSEVNNASIAFVDEDESGLSKELFNAFYSSALHPRHHRRERRDDPDSLRAVFVVYSTPLRARSPRGRNQPSRRTSTLPRCSRPARAGYIRASSPSHLVVP